MNRLLLVIAPLIVASAPASLAAEGSVAPVAIQEWTVPWPGTRPRDPYLDPQGRVWFVGQEGHYLGRLDPATGRCDKFDLEAGTGPHNLIVDAEGLVWFAANRNGYIGRFDPAAGEIRRYPMPDPEARDPHTLAFGRAGAIWFTAQFSGIVGRLETESGAVRLVRLPAPGARPYGIVVDAGGRPYFNEFGANKIGTLDPETLELREYTLPREGTRSRRIALGGDGAVWYVDYALGFLGRLDPATGAAEEWAVPGGQQALPYAMAGDDRGRLWFVETGPQPNRLVGFDPQTEAFFASAEVPSGGGTVRHMIFDPRSRQLWFGTDHDTIGRAALP